MPKGYTKNLSVQILVSLLKKHGIKNIVLSPGSTNLELSMTLQAEESFSVISSIDERSAAYMACGIAKETEEPVVVACTESTASRNYFPGLTEAYYLKLPVIAVTGVHGYNLIGSLYPQVIDRSVSPKDIVIDKEQLPVIKDESDIKRTEIMVNRALNLAKSQNCGPVHIDLPCTNGRYDFSAKELYDARMIKLYETGDELPHIPQGKIAVYIGCHKNFTEQETSLLDHFCEIYDAVVFCDHTSGYRGKYAFHSGLISVQGRQYDIMSNISCLIHLGEQMADWPAMVKLHAALQTWRVSEDGEFRDTFGSLSAVFKMTLTQFFSSYTNKADGVSKYSSFLQECRALQETIKPNLEKLPLSNIYIAGKMSQLLPSGSILHMGVSSSIRAWSFFELPESVKSYGNVGCRGIDGVLSSAVGASIVNKNAIHFCYIGDLTFYYDMNVLGNRDISGNLRIVMINNNGGGIFKLNGAPGHEFFGDEETDKYVAAANHFGGAESNVPKSYVEALGFKYFCASTKTEFDSVCEQFLQKQPDNVPYFFEIFTKDSDERKAFSMMSAIDAPLDLAKSAAKQILGEKGTRFVKNMLGKNV